MPEQCIFCDIIAGKIPSKKIYENDNVLAFLDLFPNSNGHTLVIPKKHFPDFSSTDDFYLAEVAITAKKIANKIYQVLKPQGMNYIVNEKSMGFQQVFHYHLHIVPKYQTDEGYNFKININKNSLTDTEELQKLLFINN